MFDLIISEISSDGGDFPRIIEIALVTLLLTLLMTLLLTLLLTVLLSKLFTVLLGLFRDGWTLMEREGKLL